MLFVECLLNLLVWSMVNHQIESTPPTLANSKTVNTLPSSSADELYLKNFFPATAAEFVAKCGIVSSVKAADFEDFHRRRHLESFKRSWNGQSTDGGSISNQFIVYGFVINVYYFLILVVLVYCSVFNNYSCIYIYISLFIHIYLYISIINIYSIY